MKIKIILTCALIGFTAASLAKIKDEKAKIPIYPISLHSTPGGVDSPAIKTGNLVFISGQGTGSVKNKKDIKSQIEEAFKKLQIVANGSGGDLDDVVKITVYLADISDYPILNKMMSQYFKNPYPARSTVGVSNLPKEHRIEVDAIMLVKK